MNKIYGLIGLSAKAGKIVFGADSSIELIKKHKIDLVIIAENSSNKTKKNIIYFCDKFNISYYIYGQIEELSKAVGKKNVAILGIKDENLANGVKKMINGGEIIG